MTAAIQLAGGSVDRGGTRVVHDVDLSIGRGSWFGLIGANGSGKTSLLRALAGRLPFAAGSCIIDGRELADDRIGRAERFGFSPPADRLPDALRARELFAFAGGDLPAVWRRLGRLRPALGLERLIDRWIGDCSAGMRQRLAIAVACAAGHPLVILDEPFNWLDPVAAFDLRQALRAMVDDGLTLVTALHDLGTLATVCDEGVMLADGRVTLTIGHGMLAEASRDPRAFERRTIDLLRSGSGG